MRFFLSKRFFQITIIIFSVFSILNVQAVLPVFDGASFGKLAQEFKQLQDQYKLLNDTYKNAQDQLDRANKLVTNSEGHYGFGFFKNDLKDLKERQWSPNSWKDALKGLSGGNPDRYNQLVDEYKKNNQILSEEDYKKGTSEDKAKEYQLEVAINKAATVQASYAFDDINEHLKNVHELSSKIEESKNTKAAIDLNSRLISELAYIAIQELKMQSIMNQQVALQESNRISGLTKEAKFNALPE